MQTVMTVNNACGEASLHTSAALDCKSPPTPHPRIPKFPKMHNILPPKGHPLSVKASIVRELAHNKAPVIGHPHLT